MGRASHVISSRITNPSVAFVPNPPGNPKYATDFDTMDPEHARMIKVGKDWSNLGVTWRRELTEGQCQMRNDTLATVQTFRRLIL